MIATPVSSRIRLTLWAVSVANCSSMDFPLVPVLDVFADDFNPLVLALLPDGKARGDEIGVVERAHGNRQEVVELVVDLAVDLVIDVRPALGAEMESGSVAAVRDYLKCARPALDA